MHDKYDSRQFYGLDNNSKSTYLELSTVQQQINLPKAYSSSFLRWQPLILGRMDIQCTYCHALHWINERVLESSLLHPEFTTCCLKDSVQLDPIKPLPPILFCLYYFSHEERHFKTFICGYNSALAFTSVNYSRDDRMDLERGRIQSFQIHGELYHLQGPLNPSSGQRPWFAQLYFYDPSYAAQACSTTNPNIKETLLRSIMEELREVNPWY